MNYRRELGRFSVEITNFNWRDDEQHHYQCRFGYAEPNEEQRTLYWLSVEELRDIKHMIELLLASIDRCRQQQG